MKINQRLIILLCFYLYVMKEVGPVIYDGYKTNSWQKTTGKVINSQFIKLNSKKEKYRYFVEYDYDVGNTVYRGNRIKFINPMFDWSFSRSNDKYPVNSSIDVFYDKNKENESVIEVGLSTIDLSIFIGTHFFLLYALLPKRRILSIFSNKYIKS